ncbi:hypothetical protein [Reichenbachiella ulvae]|uniref:Cytochrome c7 n=1 Tax=Reichenbachiella ulvae TaxID=2980104 RepID=A0ABT3CQH1_9BACT|nr:hypothetical protein [Reichenbachiella ulvae]MCV9385961.1 hypothetical protein [Reichenbachiella ulvae]
MEKIKSMKHFTVILSAIHVFLLVSCSNHSEKENESFNDSGHGHGLMHSLPNAVLDSVVYSEEMKRLMEDLKKVQVQLKQNEELKSEIQQRNQETFVLTRTEHMTSFPCSSCHTSVPKKLDNKDADAHWNIKLNHATDLVMDCRTCHNLDEPDQLTSLGKRPIEFNHSYQQCAQCHSSQAKEWLGGAHGKRVGGWVKPRTINNCVSCHNPHNPKIQSRWPARLNTVKLLEQNQ